MQPAPRRRKRAWIVAACALLAAVGFAVTYGRDWFDPDHRMREVEEEADRLDPGWRPDEMAARHQKPPDDRNAAVLTRAISPKLPVVWREWDRRMDAYFREPLGGPPDDRFRGDSEKNLTASADALQSALGLADMPANRRPEPPDGTWIVHFDNDSQPVASLLRCESLRSAAGGDADSALAALHAAFHAAPPVDDECPALNLLLRDGADYLSVFTLERILSIGTASDGALQTVQPDIDAPESRLLAWARGERVRLDRRLVRIQEGQELLLPSEGGGGDTGEEARNARRARPEVFRLMTMTVELAKRPTHEWQAGWAEVHRRAASMSPMSRTLIATIKRCIDKEQGCQAQLRAAQVGVAAERYRLAKGAWPAGLDDLVTSGLLKSVPTDPFDGRPMRYRKTAGGVVVYSVGPDGTDDGGVTLMRPPADHTFVGRDITFELLDPDRRGRPVNAGGTKSESK
jgi:hypothetical protein